ncbi:complex I subunit 5 family protein [Desulfonatronovibrio hydrogenovorans]|uniref:complex I subunit 5 family protein n=1 Tax=Desulfonatronovibrio hydrogenovorans TaxID=53245 RepID=UPI00048AB01A|nr:proton-conducting transporter membrane subunit [Desulfonatronovibrio hydrogenovorans]
MLELMVLIPFSGAVLCLFLPGQLRRWPGLLSAGSVLMISVLLARDIYLHGAIRRHLGGWVEPLGIGLHIDGLSVFFILMTGLVGFLVSLYSFSQFSFGRSRDQAAHFWPLWLLLWGALNTLFFVSDIFNSYVVLELISISAAALAALSGSRASLVAALRYFLVAMAGSMAFLLGIGFIYAQAGTLDMFLISAAEPGDPLMAAALGLMTVGLIMKTALFPFHFWLPPAHGEAPAPVSAVLSALVIKGSFYLLLRLWFSAFAGNIINPPVAAVMGGLGFAAVIWGSYQAIIQDRLKLIIAYSSIGQIGYLFILFPLMFVSADPAWQTEAWTACTYQTISHGLAKAALFLAAGNLIQASGTDNIRSMRNIAGRLPMTTFTLGLAGVSLMGLPPSGGFVAKWMLLQSILASGQWWLAAAPVLGGLLTAAYIFKILAHTFISDENSVCCLPVSYLMEKSALLLAIFSILIGFRAEEVIFMLENRMSFEIIGGSP